MDVLSIGLVYDPVVMADWFGGIVWVEYCKVAVWEVKVCGMG